MSRKIIALLSLVLLVTSLVGVALAAEPDGNFRKGKYLFRKNCRTAGCHVAGGDGGDLSPATMTQAKWIETFTNWQEIPCVDSWGGLSDSDRKDIFTYMHDFAKDSPTPAKCS
ncbi:c-type cytochrome [Desulfohalovibrio reitneri]|uniref:c-type cytochrome n=1 Tax=Desulfohalovibrio reitneri TaxID=1307759 RepID=UPI0004A6C887|nr:cytochrome c [Desulfohalovibrio reitneri]